MEKTECLSPSHSVFCVMPEVHVYTCWAVFGQLKYPGSVKVCNKIRQDVVIGIEFDACLLQL